MAINRRRFMGVMGVLGAEAALPGTFAAESNSSAPLSYEEVRSKLAGTKLFFVPYAHNDYGWLNSNLWDRERTALVHKEALEIMRREKEFKWFLDVKFEALDWFLDRHPEMLDELKQRVKEGRFGIAPGSFCNPDNPFMEPEAMIRNLVEGRREFEAKFPGVNLEVAIFNDIHPGHTQIPQMLRQGGYRFYRITRPIKAMDKKGYKREFIWEGLDGSEILFSYGLYGWWNPEAFDAINNHKNDWRKAVVALYERVVKDMLPNSATGLIYIPIGSDYGRPLRAFHGWRSDEPYFDIPGFLREWMNRESVQLRFAIPIDYFRELDKVRSTLPRVRGIVDPVGWPFWYGNCGSKGLDNWRERTTRDLVEAEIFSCLGSLAGGAYPGRRIDSLWNQKLTLHFHDGLYVGDEDVIKLSELGRQVEYQCRQLRRQAMQRLSHRIAADSGKQAIGLFNPLNWRRREVVELQAVFASPGTKRIRVVDGAGRRIPHQLLKLRHMGREELYYKEAWMLVEAEVPPLGYTTLYIEPEEGSEEARYPDSPVEVLESRSVRLRLGRKGIESLADKVHGVEYLGAGNPVYYSVKDSWLYHGGPIVGEARVRDARWKLVEEGALRSTAEMKGRVGDHDVEMRVSLYHSLERIDFLLTVDSMGGEGYFVAQVPFDYQGSLYAGIPFGAEIRDLTREPFGEGAGQERLRENVFFAHHWVDYSDGQKGLTLVAAEGKRGFHFDPNSRTLGHILLMTIIPQAHHRDLEYETLFSNRFFRGTGRHTFRYSLLPHRGDWKTARSLLQAQEQLYPVRWRHVHPRAGADLPLQKSFLTVTPETVALSSWLQQDDGYHLRLYETKGERASVEVKLPFAAAGCESVDFNGRRWESPRVELKGDQVKFPIQPWEIVTLRFSPARRRS